MVRDLLRFGAVLTVTAILLVTAIYVLMIDRALAYGPCTGQMVTVSWYGKETCHGRPPGRGTGFCQTASGIPFDGRQWVIAHKTLPFGTRVRLSYRGRTVTAPVDDRGPYIAGRTYDLSHAVAVALGMTGVQTVCAERL